MSGPAGKWNEFVRGGESGAQKLRRVTINANAPAAATGRFEFGTCIAITLIHLGALAVFIPQLFSWAGLILFAVMVWATASLGVSLTYHRLLSHGSYRCKPWLRYALVSLACMSLQGGPIRWSATHRLHHRESDHEDDPHSPLVNFWWSHILWNFYTNPRLKDDEALKALAPDLYRDPVLRWLDRHFFWVWFSFALLTFAIGFAFGGWTLGLSLIVWGSLARTVWVWHVTWFVNSATHMWGYRNYGTEDDSRNLWWVALVTFGEGWHNNHHAIAGVAKFGHRWWEIDTTWWALCAFRAFGWIEKVNLPEPLKGTAPARNYAGKAVAMSRALKSALETRKVSQAVD